MNKSDQEYKRLAELVLSNGRVKKNRTGVNTLGIFGAQARFDISSNFPLLTTKKVFFKGIVHELLWFIKGDTNIKYLVDNGVNIWNDNWFSNYRKLVPTGLDKEELIHLIKNDTEFAQKWGELGEGTYGGMWRAFPYAVKGDREEHDSDGEECFGLGRVDQLKKVLEKLKSNPDDRRLIVSAWHPYWVDHCALPPCHVLFQFHTEELDLAERFQLAISKGLPKPDRTNTEAWLNENNIPKRRLNCQLYQRSCDLFLGVPFNIASYSLLTILIAQVSNMMPGEFVHTYGDLHIYENHIDQIKTQIAREPLKLPTIELNPSVDNLFNFKFEDIKLVGYESHPAIKGEVAV
jgi:thymidylate synthase